MSEEILTGGTNTENAAGLNETYIVAASQKASTAYVKQVAANLKSELKAQIDEIDTAIGTGEGALGSRVTTLEGQVTILNGDATTAGSVAKQVADGVAGEAGLRKDADDDLSDRLDVIEGSGEGSVAKALADANAYTDEREEILQGNINGKVDKVAGKGLSTEDYTTAEKNKLADLPTNANLTTTLNAKANAANVYAKSETYSASEVDNKIAPLAVKATVDEALNLKANAAEVYTKTQVDAKVASVFRYNGTATIKPGSNPIVLVKDGADVVGVVGDVYQVGNEEYVYTSSNTWERLGTAVDLTPYSTTEEMNGAINGAKDAAITAAGSAADGKVSAAKAIIDAYTVNSKAISSNPVLGAADIQMTGYTPITADDVVTITTSGNINDAFRAVISHLNTLDEVSGGAVGDLSELSGRVTAAEGDIDAIEALLPKTAFNDTNTVKAAIDKKVDAVAGSSLVDNDEINKLSAYPAYSVVEGNINGKVTAVAGKSLVDDSQINKLVGLNDQATTDAALAGKVDKVEGSGLIEAAKVAKLDALPNNDQLNGLLIAKADKQPVVSAAVQTLEAGKRYVVTGSFAGTLPAGAANGSTVEIFVLVGGTGKTVTAPTGETILGKNLPCAIGISEEGWQLDNESYIFVKNGSNWHVL